MKKWIPLLVLILVLPMGAIYWLSFKLEAKAEQLLHEVKVGNLTSSVESVTISVLTSSLELQKPLIAISESYQFVAENAEIDFSSFDFIRLFWNIFINDVLTFVPFTISTESPVLKTENWSFPFASSAHVRAEGELLSALEKISSNQIPQQSFRISVSLNDVNGWKSNSSSGGRMVPIPFVEKASLSVGFQGGAMPWFDVLLSGISAGNTDGFLRTQAFYTLNSTLSSPTRLQLTSKIGGKLPIEVPIPGLKDSWFSAGNIKLDVDGLIESSGVQKMNVNLESDDFVWQPPALWPPNLSMLYFVYGSEPKEVKLDSARLDMQYSPNALVLDECFADGEVLRLDAKIKTEKDIKNSQLRFIPKSVADIRFKTPEALQLAQIFAGMSGFSRGKPIQKRTVIELSGPVSKPDIKILNNR